MIVQELRELLSGIPNQQAEVTAQSNGDLIELNVAGHSISVPYRGENRLTEGVLEAMQREGRLLILPVPMGDPVWVVDRCVKDGKCRFEVREDLLALEHLARFGDGSIYFSEEEAMDVANILNSGCLERE